MLLLLICSAVICLFVVSFNLFALLFCSCFFFVWGEGTLGWCFLSFIVFGGEGLFNWAKSQDVFVFGWTG